MNIQLVVADIDGTLLDSKDVLSKGALGAIQKLREKGIGFTLCSGRGDPGIRPYMELLKLEFPYIASAGAAILDATGQSIIYQRVLNDQQIRALIELGCHSKCELVSHTATQLYVLSSDKFWGEVCEERWIRRGGWKNVFRCDSQMELLDKPIIHIHFFHQDELLPRLAQEVHDLNVNVHANIVVSKLEITDCVVSKGHALSHLADHLKIPLENVVSVGDDVNDVSMFKAAGIGVALRNSPSEVIRQVEYLAPGCEEGGLAETIQHVISGTLDSLRADRTA